MPKALSLFISAVLVILLGIVVISLVLSVIEPALNKAKDSAIINEAFQNLELIDDNIEEVASEGEDARRTISLKVTEGMYKVDPDNNYINFTYRMGGGLDISGQRDKVNIIRSGNDITLFIAYTNLDIVGSDHFTKGMNSVLILYNETNATGHPRIYVGK